MEARISTRTQEFVAHSGGVNCLRIGPKSGRILVTGGDDKRVCLWTVGSSQPIVSLAGHSSPVESVALDHDEQIAVAGSSQGVIRLWDLEQAKVVRTLSGHKDAVRAVEFHPYGEFFTSSSADSSLRVWDIRKRSCIQTYRGHTGSVSVAKFSPDGRWLLSGGEDGFVKLWDLTAGKLLHSFPQVSGAIGGLQFHPYEFLLAFSSSDRVTRFWDLESFSFISATQPEETPIQCILFDQGSPKNPNEGCRALLSLSQSSIKSYQWEPLSVLDSKGLSLPSIKDATFLPNTDQLVVGSTQGEFVSLWTVNLALKPFTFDEKPDIPGGMRGEGSKPQTEVSKPESERRQRPAQPLSSRKTFDRGDPAFAPVSNLESDNSEADVLQKIGDPHSNLHNNFPGDLAGYDRANPNANKLSKKIGGDISEADRRERSFSMDTKDKKKTVGKDPGPSMKSSPSFDFLKCTLDMSGNEATQEHELLESLSSGHYSMIGIMSARLTAYRSLRSACSASGMKGVSTTLENIGDSVVLLDILNSALANKLALETCTLMLPAVLELLRSPYESYAERAVQHLKLLARSFSSIIFSTLEAERYPSQGIDINREERLERCRSCFQNFAHGRLILEKMLSQASSNLSANVKACLLELDGFRIR